VLDRLSNPALLANVRDRGEQVREGLSTLQASNARVRAFRGRGLIWGIDVAEPARNIVARAMDLGLLVCSAGDHTVRLLPPLVISREDIQRGIAILGRAIG